MSRRDEDLERLLDLDGFLAEVGGGFWVKMVARRVPPDAGRPHGISYTLTTIREDDACSASTTPMWSG